jgi:hypothetical protein
LSFELVTYRGVQGVLSFLLYYVRLRVDVLLGRHQTTRPLGLRYRWRQWQYTRHLRWLKGREWQEGAAVEVATEPKPRVEGKNKAAARRAA